MKKYLRIIKNNLDSMLSVGSICFVTIIFIYAFLVKFNCISNINNFGQIINIIFYGPNNLSDNIIEVFIWGLYQFFLIYTIGNYYFKEFNIRSIYKIPRIGNKQNWHICLHITCFLACFLYFIFGFFIIFICTSVVNKAFNFNGISEAFKIIGLLSITSYYIMTVYIFIIVITKKHNGAFLSLITSLLLLIAFGDILKIDKYIPFNQGILSKHIFSNFDYWWSFIFLAILIFINLTFINILIVKRDLFEITH